MRNALCTYIWVFICFTLIAGGLLAPGAAHGVIVTFVDPDLEQAVRVAIGRNDTAPIDHTELEVETFTALNASSRGITDLTGIEWCRNLRTLQLYNNNITDISRLANLRELRDIYLWNNKIADISALGNLANLRYVFLHNNKITDISPLMGNPSWTEGDILNISGNYIDQYGLCHVLPDLVSRGVLIYKDAAAVCNAGIRVDVLDPALEQQLRWALKLQNTQLYPYLLDTDLARLTSFTANNKGIKNLSGLEYCVNLRTLELNGNELTNISQISRLSLLNRLMLGGNQITDLSALSELYSLMELNLEGNDISDLAALRALGGLVMLYLNNNQISDITELQWLLNLRALALDHNNISNINTVSRFDQLRHLRLGANQIADITPLRNLFRLQSLNLGANLITDVTPLRDLTELMSLDLSNNSIADIRSLDRLKKIIYLYLHDNEIRVVNILAGFPELSVITLANNMISDISPLVANAGFGDPYWREPLSQLKDMLDVRGNKLSLESICHDIPELRLRNVIVRTDAEQECDILAESYTLTMAVAVSGTGTVDPEEGTRTYASGTRIVLSANPSEGYDFRSWTGDFESTENPVEIIMDSSKLIRAVFAESSLRFRLSTEIYGSGEINLDPPPSVDTGDYPSETQVTVTATPASGWVFDSWEGDLTGTANPQQITMNSDKTVSAVFIEQGPPQTLRIFVEGNGTTNPAPGTYQHPRDDYVSIQAIPGLGHRFSHWTGDLQGTAEQGVVQMTGAKTVTAVFVPDGYDHTLSIGVADGGTTNPSPGFHRYYSGDTATITAVPQGDYVFDRWQGASTSSVNPLTIVMNGDKSLTAVFVYAPVRYVLSLAATEGGTTSPAPGNYIHPAGKKVTVSATPEQGYVFDGWEGAYAGSAASVLVTINDDINMLARFKPYPFLTGVNPDKGTTLGGNTVSISGGRLDEAIGVLFNDTPGVILAREYDVLTVRTPAHPRGVANIIVVTPDGETDPLIGAFTFVEPPGPPTYGEVNPVFGRIAGGDAVLIRGQNLQLTQSVLFGGEPAHITSSTESRLSVITPPHPEGVVDIIITTTTGTVTGQAAFTYLPPPQIVAITPEYGRVSGGEEVVMWGVNLGQTHEIVFGGAPAQIISRTPYQVTVIAPPHAAGAVNVMLMTPGGTIIADSPFTYYSVGGSVVCQVIDIGSQRPITDATVRVGAHLVISGSADGAYRFADVTPGAYDITVVTSGCGQETRALYVQPGQASLLDFEFDCGSDRSQRQCQSPVKRLDGVIAEKTMPYSVQDAPLHSVAADSALAVRVTADQPIDAATAWAYVEAADWAGSGGVWRPVDPEDGRDGWVVYTPDELMPAGQIVTMTVGASTADGVAVGPVSYDFAVRAADAGLGDKAFDQPELAVATGIPALPGLLAAPRSEPYRICPPQVFDQPATLLIPLPNGSGEDIDIYYYSESVEHLGWHPAQNVAGFIEPGARELIVIDGQRYIELQVNHGGIIQLGQTVRLKIGNSASIEFGFAGNKFAWLAMLGAIAALSLALRMMSRGRSL